MSYFALIGSSLKHSFSSAYFRQKFIEEGLDHEYGNIELDHIGYLPDILNLPDLCGLNVTFPYKVAVIPYLAGLTPLAEKVGAVNTIFKHDGQWYGHNTDYIGFGQSMMSNYDPTRPSLLNGTQPALVLGNGGAAKAVKQVLTDIGLEYHLAVRSLSGSEPAKQVLYLDLEGTLSRYGLIVNTTPVGTWPNAEDVLLLPLDELGTQHHIMDLVYNPKETRLMREGRSRGATAINGDVMLVGQAEASWAAWMGNTDLFRLW